MIESNNELQIEENSSQNEIYETRMNEFCANHLNVPVIVNNLKRPKCSVSPIDNNSNIELSVNNESYSQNTTNQMPSSPFVSNNIITKTTYLIPNNSSSTSSLYDSVLQENVNTSNGLFTTSSPYYLSKQSNMPKISTNGGSNLSKNLLMKNFNDSSLKPIQFQSTPNKTNNSSSSLLIPVHSTKVNFHSILDLAKSDDQKSSSSNDNDSINLISVSNADTSGYVSASNLTNISTIGDTGSSLINFNEHLNLMSMSWNKENAKMDFLSKVTTNIMQTFLNLNNLINQLFNRINVSQELK